MLSLSLHRPFGTHCRTMSSTRDTLATFKKRLKTRLFSLRHVKRSWHWAPLHFLSRCYASFYHVFTQRRMRIHEHCSCSKLDFRRKHSCARESTATLKAWLFQHIKNPYPTKTEKIMLAVVSKMTLTQVSTWFANARRRLKKDSATMMLRDLPVVMATGRCDDASGNCDVIYDAGEAS